METIILILSLIIIGFISYYAGVVAEKLKLPSLIGMIAIGMLIGPAFLNIVPKGTLDIAPAIKDGALVIVLLIGGLGISIKQMKQIGRPALLLSVLPAVFEGLIIGVLSMWMLDFSFIQGAILGFIIAAVSPAVLVPSMVELINKKIGQDKAIPQMLLVGASADDTIAITLFTTFLGIYFTNSSGDGISILSHLVSIPITIIVSIISGWIIAVLTKNLIKIIRIKIIRILFVLIISFAIRLVENKTHFIYFNSLLTIMVYGFFIRTYLDIIAKKIQDGINLFWKFGKLYLFIFVGMAINPKLVGEYFFIGIIILIISLSFRSIGVLLSLIGTNLSNKERLFCVIAYLPKATVQSAKSGIPLQMGVVGGEVMQAIAILSVLITAPIGAIGIKLTASRFLSSEVVDDEDNIT